MKKFVTCFLMMALFIVITGDSNISAKAKSISSKDYKGMYYMKGNYKEPSEEHGAYIVYIKKIKNGYVTFYVDYAGRNYSPIYGTGKLKAKINGKKADFKWSDDWENSGKGTLWFVKKHKIKLNMKQTKTAEWNRASLDTNGTKVFLFFKK